MPIQSDDYLSFIQKEIAPLYFQVKAMNVRAENFDEQSRSYIAPFNEFRNTWDHMIKAAVMDNTKDGIDNLNEAKVHLFRAGYDIYEIFASDLGLRIAESIEKYSSEDISRVFPQYYSDFQPLIITIHQELSTVRSTKNVDGNGNSDSFQVYEKNIEKLIEIYKNIQGYIPVLEKEKKRGFLKLIKEHFITVIITLITSLLVGYWLFKLGLV